MLELLKKKYSAPEIEFVYSLNGDIMSASTDYGDNDNSDEGWFDWV